MNRFCLRVLCVCNLSLLLSVEWFLFHASTDKDLPPEQTHGCHPSVHTKVYRGWAVQMSLCEWTQRT